MFLPCVREDHYVNPDSQGRTQCTVQGPYLKGSKWKIHLLLLGDKCFLFCHFFSAGHQVPIFSTNSYFLLFFSQFAVGYFISGFFFQVLFFQCGNTCTERAVLWEKFSHGVVWMRFSHKSLTNVWRSVDLTPPHPGYGGEVGPEKQIGASTGDGQHP